MGRRNKKSSKKKPLEIIIFLTALLSLIEKLIDLIKRLL